jgi:predicted enzyme related to lactoylglutathione lyase
MSSDATPKTGSISWQDLTVANASEIKDFYSQVAGWKSSPVSMGNYDDYCMMPADGKDPVAGICHARGANVKIPPQWLIYITVENVQKSAERCTALGGTVLDGPRAMGGGQFCVIRDPAGAVAALFQQ